MDIPRQSTCCLKLGLFKPRCTRQIDSRPVSNKALELETAKEILSEVFHARPADVEEMIQRRLEERDWHEEREDGLWPATFFLGE
jgi:hypothetical protein